ncbi:MAG TPA: hypothetical protein PLC80_16580 [Draconibacterium sp.]|nr:hypothetical protein [Draconibacterium sp.]
MVFIEFENYYLILKKNNGMNTEAVRLRLINWISQLEDEILLKKIDSIRIGRKEGWNELSIEDQLAIEEGLNQLNEGQSFSYNDVRKEIKSLLNPNS